MCFRRFNTFLSHRHLAGLVFFIIVAVAIYCGNVSMVVRHAVTFSANSMKNVYDSEAKFVTVCREFLSHRHGTGNQLFIFAAIAYIAEFTGRAIIMPDTRWFLLNQTFDLHFRRADAEFVYKNSTTFRPSSPYNSDARLLSAKGLEELHRNAPRTLAVCGGHQTFVYADIIGKSFRRLLQFRPEIRQSVVDFLESSRPSGWSPGSYVRVGIHVRRGDFLTRGESDYGLTVIDDHYLNSSMNYFLSRHKNIHFIVATNDIEWTAKAVVNLFVPASNVSFHNTTLASRYNYNISDSSVLSFTSGQSASLDFAIVASCDAVITSTGSFSWWAGWLANKTTVYYDNWPRKGSSFAHSLNRATYFPDRWIPLM